MKYHSGIKMFVKFLRDWEIDCSHRLLNEESQ